MLIGLDTLRTKQYGIFELDSSNPDWFNFVEQLAAASKGTIYNLKEYRIINGATIGAGSVTVKGIFYDSVIFEHPPYALNLGGSDFIEYTVPVPAAPKVTLTFDAAIGDGNEQSDGVIFGVQVNQQTVWRQTVLPGTGWNNGSADLTPYAGTTVKLRFLTHPGTMLNPLFDAACWKALRINTDFSTTSTLQLQLTPGSTAPVFTPNITVSSVGSGVANISMSVPGKFSVFTVTPPTLIPGGTLLDTPFATWNATGGLPSPGAYDSSGTISQVSSAGVTRRAIAAIPPRDGQSLLTTAVMLPPTATSMTVSYGLADGQQGSGSINYSGVTFIVRANGTEVLRRTVNTAGWSQTQVDLSQWKGQPVLFELITDADGDQLFDFSYYSDLSIH
jgi:hypothetical protein